MTPTRKRIAALFADPHAPRPRLGASEYYAATIDGRHVLRVSNYHGDSSVIRSWSREAKDPAALIRVIWQNRRHYRRPYPTAPPLKSL